MRSDHWLGIDELIENDLSSYEFFNSLSPNMQKKLLQRDFGSFKEMKQYVADCRSNKKKKS